MSFLTKKRRIIMKKATSVVVALLMMLSFGFAANVTFKVHMEYQVAQGNFNPVTDTVDVIGGFTSGWSTYVQLTDDDHNNVWEGTLTIAEGDYGFKFRINHTWNALSEFYGIDNSDRQITVCSADQVYEYWYNNASATPVIVFKVDMGDQINLGNFNPASDYVDIAGSFNGWKGANHHLTPTGCDDAIWQIMIADSFTVGEAIQFKLRINGSWDAGKCEADPNREYTPVANVQEYSDYWNRYDYNFAVTFEVNMSYQIRLGNFNPTSDYVDIAGTLNGWDGSNQHLTDSDADSIWSITLDSLMVPGDTIQFKFRINGSWDAGKCEADPNREYIVLGGTQTYSVWWNNFDPNFVGSNVQFSVNMNGQINAGLFDPAVNNTVKVKGTFDGWAGTSLTDADADGIYTAVVSVPIGPMQYLFQYVDKDGVTVNESLTQNRMYTVELSSETIVLETVWFDNVEEVTYGSGNITFRVDMTVLQALGFYNRALGDSLQLRGGFNRWGSAADRTIIDMLRQPGAEIYYLTVPYEGYKGDNISYKFFLNLHSGANHSGEDFYEYELPAGWGGGDRYFTWHGMDQDTLMPIQTFQDYVTAGVIPDNDSILVHLRIDMTDALTYEEDAFDPANDRLFFVWEDAWGAVLQGAVAGELSDSSKYEYHNTGENNIWQCSFYINGPAPHAIMYKTRYVKADGATVDEAGPGYSFGRYRTQWLKPNASGVLSREQYLDVVKFSIEGLPLEVEPEPFANGIIYTRIEEEKGSVSKNFRLNQNFPNPFNPTTQIRFAVPERSDATLTIYNALGQMVNKVAFTNLSNGVYSYFWDGKDMRGNNVASGVYLYELRAGDKFRDLKKMVLLK